MTTQVFASRPNLLFLDNNEVFINEYANVIVSAYRVSKDAIHVDNNEKFLDQLNLKTHIHSKNFILSSRRDYSEPDSGAFVIPFNKATMRVRLCSLSLYLEPEIITEHGTFGLNSSSIIFDEITTLKIPFSRISKVEYSLDASLHMILYTSEIVRMTFMRISLNQVRMIKPFLFDRASEDSSLLWKLQFDFVSNEPNATSLYPRFSANKQSVLLSSQSMLKPTTIKEENTPRNSSISFETLDNRILSPDTLETLLCEFIRNIRKVQCPTTEDFVIFSFLLIQLYLLESQTASISKRFPRIINSILLPCPSLFPLSTYVHYRETILLSSMRVQLQHPLHRTSGVLYLTNRALCFRPYPQVTVDLTLSGQQSLCDQKYTVAANLVSMHSKTSVAVCRIPLSSICYVFQRYCDLHLSGLCVLYATFKAPDILENYGELLFIFESTKSCEAAQSVLRRVVPPAFICQQSHVLPVSRQRFLLCN